MNRSILLALGLSVWFSAPEAANDVDIPGLVRQAKPAVVQIVALDQQNKPLKTGTGFFISGDGELLTNYHVISGATSILAKTPSGAIYFLKGIVSVSPPTDVALLQFYATDVPHLTLGSTTDAVEGQRVLVIGNPEGLEGTVSDGIISAFRENRSMIQITAPISHGSSGSPVLDESGQVLGIATLVFWEGQNLNFAISAETIRNAITKSAVASSPAESTQRDATQYAQVFKITGKDVLISTDRQSLSRLMTLNAQQKKPAVRQLYNYLVQKELIFTPTPGTVISVKNYGSDGIDTVLIPGFDREYYISDLDVKTNTSR
jgi:hypothetical protein